MKTQAKMPKVAIIPITYNCNAKCVMCNIWKKKSNPEISKNDLIKVFQDPILVENLESINLTGGEPLLRRDLIEIARELLFCCSKLRSITINSNGFLTNRMLDVVKNLCALQQERPYELFLFLSLDGMYEMHDHVRGVDGSYEKVMRTLRRLQELKNDMSFSCSVNFTISTMNYRDMRPVYDCVTKMGIPIDFTYNMSSPIYFQADHDIGDTNKSQNEYICSAIEDFINDGNLSYSRSYYRNLIKMINGEKRKIGCIFTDRGFFLHPSGDVYRCWAFDQKIGNIYANTFSEIWNSPYAIDSASRIRLQCEKCYNNCYSHFLRIDAVKSLITNGC